MLTTNIDDKCWLPVLTKNVDWQCWKVVNDNQFWLTMLTTNADYQYWLPVWLLMLTTDTDYQCWLPFALIMQSEAISRNGWQNLQNISDSLTLQHGSKTLGPKRREILYSGKERLSLAKFIRLSADTCVQTQEGRTFFLKYVTWDGDDDDDDEDDGDDGVDRQLVRMGYTFLVRGCKRL